MFCFLLGKMLLKSRSRLRLNVECQESRSMTRYISWNRPALYLSRLCLQINTSDKINLFHTYHKAFANKTSSGFSHILEDYFHKV